MATGVEMLGQMSEDMQLAGPVSGGNMVVKPNEAPVGAAAMLSKALRREANKGVAGIYELPMPKEPLPEFMKAAQQNVKMQGDPMRGMGPREGLTPFDIANMSGAVEQAGIINFLGRQPEVTVPIRAKSHADAPPTQLAYITDAEKQMLINANMHGSLDGEPNPGPGGVQSLDDYYNYVDSSGQQQVGGGSGEQVFSSGVDTGSSTAGQGGGGNQGQGGYQSSEDFFTEQLAEDQDFGAYGNNQALMSDTANITYDDVFGKKDKTNKETTKKSKKDEKAELELQNLQEELDVLNAKGKDITRDEKKRIKELNKKLQKIFDEQQKSLFDDTKKSIKDMDKDEKKKRFAELFKKQQSGGQLTSAEQREIKALRDDKTTVGMFKVANMLDDLGIGDADIGSISDPNTMSLVAYEQGLLNKDGTLTGKGENFATKYGDEIDFLGIDDFGSYLEGIKGGVEGTQSQRAIDRKNFYLDNKNFTNATSGQAAQLAGEQLYSNEDIKNMTADEAYKAKMFNRKVIEARDIASRDRNNNRPSGFSRPVVIDEEDVTEQIVEADDMTMPYKGPRTGDKEVDVPLSRRFKTDPTKDVAQFTQTPRTQEDIYKYMTQGTTGEGITLEPFSEYQRRRRKALGLDPLELYG